MSEKQDQAVEVVDVLAEVTASARTAVRDGDWPRALVMFSYAGQIASNLRDYAHIVAMDSVKLELVPKEMLDVVNDTDVNQSLGNPYL